MAATENNNSRCEIRIPWNSLLCIIFIILLGTVPLFFFNLLTKEALNNSLQHSNEKSVSTFNHLVKDSLNSFPNLSDEKSVFAFDPLVKASLNSSPNLSEEKNVIAEMDLAVDKFSQWTGYWLSIISCVIALFTLIQAYTNYQSRQDTKKEIEDAKKENKEKYKEQKIEFEKQKEELKEQNKKIEKRFIELSEEMRSSAYQNRLSCISACISTFPDAFSLTPTSERQLFTKSFLQMLFMEYDEYTNYVKMAIDCMKVCKESGSSMHIDLCKEVKYVYLIWCDISIAVNHAMNDFSSVDQNIAFNDLKDLLSTAIRDYHDNIINPTNVAERMLEIKEAMRQLINIL